jgi:hypothetical protein
MNEVNSKNSRCGSIENKNVKPHKVVYNNSSNKSNGNNYFSGI